MPQLQRMLQLLSMRKQSRLEGSGHANVTGRLGLILGCLNAITCLFNHAVSLDIRGRPLGQVIMSGRFLSALMTLLMSVWLHLVDAGVLEINRIAPGPALTFTSVATKSTRRINSAFVVCIG